MSFLTPALLALFGLALPVFIAFLSRKKVEQRVVPSLLILRHVTESEPRSRRYATPKNLLILLLYLLALAALVVAAAQPSFEGEEPRELILVLDASSSMAARVPDPEGDGETSRLELARRIIAQEVLPKLGDRERATLIVGDPSASVRVESTRDVRRHEAALAAVTPGGTQAHLARALQLADALCQGKAHAQILLFTDEAAHLEPLLTPRCAHSVIPIAPKSEPPNVAITRLSTRALDALGTHEVFLEVFNASTSPREVVVELHIDDTLSEVLALELEPLSSAGRLTRVTTREGGALEARLVPQQGQPDALPLDDVAYAALSRVDKLDVVLVSDRKFSFIERALALHPRVSLTMVPASESVSALKDAELVIFETGATQAVLEAVPDGARVVVLGPGAGSLSDLAFGEAVERPMLDWWSFEDALLRYMELDEVEILSASPVLARPEDQVLMRNGQDRALLVRRTLGGHEALVMGFHPDQSDLVLRVAFANLMANIVEWASDADVSRSAPRAVTVGDALVGALDATTLVHLAGPHAAPLAPGALTRHAGVWQIEGGAQDGALVVVNHAARGEALLSGAPAAFEGWTVLELESLEHEDRGAWLTRLLLIAAGLFLMIEALLSVWRARRARRSSNLPLSDRMAARAQEVKR